MKPTAGAGYKWRLVIAYDGTHYAGFLFLCLLFHDAGSLAVKSIGLWTKRSPNNLEHLLCSETKIKMLTCFSSRSSGFLFFYFAYFCRPYDALTCA